ncbi:MAG TPA: FtsW/RodA/SpoVE family cell cycle protein, partial [Chthonomonadales bacterium]|nr:FtsW/RodA/SpoVE family cell cycle protein [Chthonomonadales bacterium]
GPEGVKINLLGFQPVEIVKLLLIIFLAAYLADRAELLADRSSRAGTAAPGAWRLNLPRMQDLAPLLALFTLALGMFYIIRDMGPGLLIFAAAVCLLYLATGRIGFITAGILLILVGGVLGYYCHVGVFGIRVDMWLNPFSNHHPSGMQLGQGYWAISSGGTEGSGLGMGMMRLIPRGQDDLALTSWVEQTGIVGAMLVLSLYAVLVWRGVSIALRASSDLDRYLAFGLSAMMGMQTLLIAAGVTGAIPLTGITLPFISYGNTSVVASFVLIGLLYGISASAADRPQVARLEVISAARRFCCVVTLLLLGGIGVMRVGVLSAVDADADALRPIYTPDADGVVRPHLNPRLAYMARRIPRGSIYDRFGLAVAASGNPPIEGTDTPVAAGDFRSGVIRYPFGSALAQLVGYTDRSAGGPTGLESKYDAALRGYTDSAELLREYRNRNLPGFRLPRGADVRLAIDARLQRDLFHMVQSRLSEHGAGTDRAALVVLDPANGDVLAAVSTPSFDTNYLSRSKFLQYTTG